MKRYITHKKLRNQKGFTIVELLIAMAVFQVILILSVTVYLQISRYYQKTINANRLQQVSNGVVDDIARSIQNTGGLVSGNFLTAIDVAGATSERTDTKQLKQATITLTDGASTTTFTAICVDNTRYMYRLNVREQGGDPNSNFNGHAFISDTIASASVCASADYTVATQSTNHRLILGPDMWLYGFSILQNGNQYTVSINAAYTSDNDDVDTTMFTTGPPASGYLVCKSGSGRQYCAVSNVNTTVTRRIGL